jgi:hypothetical protein
MRKIGSITKTKTKIAIGEKNKMLTANPALFSPEVAKASKKTISERTVSHSRNEGAKSCK